MGFQRKHRSSSFINCLIFLLSISATLSSTRGSLKFAINEDFHHEDDINPCDFGSFEDPSGFCFCDKEDAEEAEDVKCGFQRNPTKKEWQAIAMFRIVTSIQFMNRPALAIREVPPPYVFSGMKNLHYFTMKRSDLGNIPSFTFGNSSGVAVIDLQDNNILELSPYSFSNLINLTLINLSENNISEISRDVFVNLPRLKELVLMKNGIQTIHDYAFKELRNLENLALQNNRLSVISPEVFTGLTRLKHLDLQENSIEYIGDHVFAEMPRLQDLDLHGNRIVSVSPSAFAGLKQIARLNLKDNKIVNLMPETFTHLNRIHFLDLRTNELETLNYSLMKPIYKNLKNMNMQLLVDGNRFLCDCRILWIKSLYEETESNYVRTHLSGTTCNLFESAHKHVTVASSSSSPSSDIKLLASPPEETTTYALDSVMQVVNLTEKDVNCEEQGGNPLQDTSYSYNHQPTKQTEEVQKHSIASSNNWDKKSDSPQRDSQLGNLSLEGMVMAGNHNSLLNEPQATAALEGTDIAGNAPQSTSSADQKVDTSRITQASPSSSAARFRICDSSALLLSLITLLLFSSKVTNCII